MPCMACHWILITPKSKANFWFYSIFTLSLETLLTVLFPDLSQNSSGRHSQLHRTVCHTQVTMTMRNLVSMHRSGSGCKHATIEKKTLSLAWDITTVPRTVVCPLPLKTDQLRNSWTSSQKFSILGTSSKEQCHSQLPSEPFYTAWNSPNV